MTETHGQSGVCVAGRGGVEGTYVRGERFVCVCVWGGGLSFKLYF